MTFHKNVSIPRNLYAARRDKHLALIHSLYFGQLKNLNEVYEETGVSPQTSRRIFKENGLALRSRSEAITVSKEQELI
jgi:hypothetical protein